MVTAHAPRLVTKEHNQEQDHAAVLNTVEKRLALDQTKTHDIAMSTNDALVSHKAFLLI